MSLIAKRNKVEQRYTFWGVKGSADGHEATGSKIQLHDHKQRDAMAKSSSDSPSLFLSE